MPKRQRPKTKGQKKPARRLRDTLPAVRETAAVQSAGTEAPRGQDSAESTDSAAPSPGSEIARDFLRFTEELRSNAGEALRFVEDRVKRRLSAPATKHAETRHMNRAESLSRELLSRAMDFAEIDSRCSPSDPCRTLIDDLNGGGLRGLITTVVSGLNRLRSHASHPLNEEERELLSHDVNAVQRNLTYLMDLADEFAKMAKTLLRGVSSEVGQIHAVLPSPIEDLVSEAEQAGSRFYEFLAEHSPSFSTCSQETLIGFLSRIRAENERIGGETDAFTAVLAKFTDETCLSIEAAGHLSLSEVLRDRERILNKVSARRSVRANITTLMIRDVISRLSLRDDELDAASKIVFLLERIQERLEKQCSCYERAALDAADARLAEGAASPDDLPDWVEIRHALEGDGSGLAGLDLLIMAILVERDGDATKNELKERLDHLSPEGRSFSISWVDRRLKVAVAHGIVVRRARQKGQSRRLPDVFRLSAAAIRKYRPHSPPGP